MSPNSDDPSSRVRRTPPPSSATATPRQHNSCPSLPTPQTADATLTDVLANPGSASPDLGDSSTHGSSCFLVRASDPQVPDLDAIESESPEAAVSRRRPVEPEYITTISDNFTDVATSDTFEADATKLFDTVQGVIRASLGDVTAVTGVIEGIKATVARSARASNKEVCQASYDKETGARFALRAIIETDQKKSVGGFLGAKAFKTSSRTKVLLSFYLIVPDHGNEPARTTLLRLNSFSKVEEFFKANFGNSESSVSLLQGTSPRCPDTEITGSKLDDVHGRPPSNCLVKHDSLRAVPTYYPLENSPPSNWLVKQDSLRAVPTYYPLEKSSRYITGSNVEEIAHRISDCCRIMGVQADFDHDMSTASLRTAEHVEIQVSLWQGTAPRYPDCIIVEAQRRRGDAVTYHKYCRNILDAADGAFDPELYKRMEQKEPATKGNTEYENSLLALEIAASLLKKDRMDAQQLGMESLCLLTDPTRTGTETALLASRGVLLGTTQDENVDDDEDACDELGIREAILSLVQFGRLGENGDFGADQDIDSDDEDAAVGHPEEKQHNDMLHNLPLAVLANALEVLENHRKRIAAGTESTSSVANPFLNESKEMMDRDLLSILLYQLGNADSKPHDACLSAQCL